MATVFKHFKNEKYMLKSPAHPRQNQEFQPGVKNSAGTGAGTLFN
jgi:hypothetical protein